METNVLYCGDCKDILKKHLPDESVDLLYADPPFFSNRDFESFWLKDSATKTGFSDTNWSDVKNQIDPVILKEYEAIEERWKGGKKGIYVYLAYLKDRIIQCERVLKDTGSIWLHCDWHAGHYIKVMMDEVFGYDNFRNDVIWKRTNSSKAQTDGFGKQHDILLFYTKSDKFEFHPQYRQPDEKYLSSFRSDDGDGRGPYQTVALSNKTTAGGFAKMKTFIWRGVTARWIYSEENLEKWWKEGRIYTTSSDMYRLKKYLSEMRGPPVSDIWIDNEVAPLQGQDKQTEGYPTQKPESLLERIINASSVKNDIVVDPFCGCGTALLVSKRLGRRYIGIDISRSACDVTKSRLGDNPRIVGGETLAEIQSMAPHDFERWVIVERLGGILNKKRMTGDLGIDGWAEFKTIPIQVKQSDIGRPAIDNFLTSIKRDGKTQGIFVAYSFSSGAVSEVGRAEAKEKIKIKLITVKELTR